MIANRFPVVPRHYVALRPGGTAPEERLPQCIHGPEEVEDLLACVRTLNGSWRVYFNSNRGSDGSFSGSSVNHWHFQLLEYPEDATPLEAAGLGAAHGVQAEASEPARPEVRRRELPAWPARHAALEGESDAALAREAWRLLRPVHARDAAYNLELSCLPGGTARVLLFPRAPGSPVEVPGLSPLEPNFGGMELSGDVVLGEDAALAWFLEHPDEGARLTARRLRETTCAPPPRGAR